MTTTSDKIIQGLDKWIEKQVRVIIGREPLFIIFQDTALELVNKYMDNIKPKIADVLNVLADKDGNIDFDTKFSQALHRLTSMPKMPSKLVKNDKLVIGGGEIFYELFLGIGLTFRSTDINELRTIIMSL